MSDKSSGAIVSPDLSHNPAHTAQGRVEEGERGNFFFIKEKRLIVDSWIKKGYIDSKTPLLMLVLMNANITIYPWTIHPQWLMEWPQLNGLHLPNLRCWKQFNCEEEEWISVSSFILPTFVLFRVDSDKGPA